MTSRRASDSVPHSPGCGGVPQHIGAVRPAPDLRTADRLPPGRSPCAASRSCDLEAFVQAGRVEPMTEADVWRDLRGWPDGEPGGPPSFGNVRQAARPAASRRATSAPMGAAHPHRRRSTTKKDADTLAVAGRGRSCAGRLDRPERAKVPLGDYAERWIRERAGLRPRTVELYRWLLRKHIVPSSARSQLGTLSTPLIRQWRADLLDAACLAIDGGQVVPAAAGGPEHRGRRGRDHLA